MDSKIEASVIGWHTPPVTQGQMIEVAYGADPESQSYFRRSRDRASGRVGYDRADMNSLRGDWEPWNAHPQVQWQPVR